MGQKVGDGKRQDGGLLRRMDHDRQLRRRGRKILADRLPDLVLAHPEPRLAKPLYLGRRSGGRTGLIFTGLIFTGLIFTGLIFTGLIFTGLVLNGALIGRGTGSALLGPSGLPPSKTASCY